MLNLDPFGQQENEDVQAELANRNNSLDHFENESVETHLEEISSQSAYTMSILMLVFELNTTIAQSDQKQHPSFNIAHGWAKPLCKKQVNIIPLNVEPMHIFLTGNPGGGKSFSMKVLYQ